MSFIRILENDDFIVDYNKGSGMYRVGYFEDGHFKDEVLFGEYKKEKDKILKHNCMNEHTWLYYGETTGGTRYKCLKCGIIETLPHRHGF